MVHHRRARTRRSTGDGRPRTATAPERAHRGSITRLAGAWGAALVVWLAGFTIVVRLASRAPSGESLSDLDRLVRIDLPWVVIAALMVVAAGAVHRDRTRGPRWFAAVLTMPLLFTAIGIAAPFSGDGDTLSAVLYVAEGLAGAALGLAAAAAISVKPERHSGYW